MRVIVAFVLLIGLLSPGARADEAHAEIDYLLSSIGSSECTFIRNGKQYNAQDAEAHLRMKYRRGKRYASTGEKFIERLASKSSISKKLYYIECENKEKVPSGDWLMQRLNEYRASSATEDEGRSSPGTDLRFSDSQS
jgi:Family of unknown function (DUF5329)